MNDIRTRAAIGPAWAPLRHRAFAVIWSAALVSNVGTWMNDVGAGWLMTTLSPSPTMVALVQTAMTLPVLLFALPAGALADIVDRRRLLIAVQAAAAVVVAVFAVLVWKGLVTPLGLLLFNFILGTGLAFFGPTRNAVVPKLVPPAELHQAVMLNGIGMNVSRAIGPALAGMVIVSVGVAAPFAFNALSFLGVVAAFIWWRPPPAPPLTAPREQLWGAMVAGLRFARGSDWLRAALLRGLAFFLFASALWALLPLVARELLAGGAPLYGFLNAGIGVGAVGGALLVPRLRHRLDGHHLVMLATLVLALALAVVGLVQQRWAVGIAMLLFGGAWITGLASLNVSAQVALPDWVRARGMALFLMVMFGSLSLGSALWGGLASHTSIPAALLTAAMLALLGILLTRRAVLRDTADCDLAPVENWPAPMVDGEIPEDRGPVMVLVEYDIATTDRAAFVSAMGPVAKARRRLGAFGWELFEDAARPGRFVESFVEASWADHLRHHARISEADLSIGAAARRFHQGPEPPRVQHLIPPRLPDQRGADPGPGRQQR